MRRFLLSVTRCAARLLGAQKLPLASRITISPPVLHGSQPRHSLWPPTSTSPSPCSEQVIYPVCTKAPIASPSPSASHSFLPSAMPCIIAPASRTRAAPGRAGPREGAPDAPVRHRRPFRRGLSAKTPEGTFAASSPRLASVHRDEICGPAASCRPDAQTACHRSSCAEQRSLPPSDRKSCTRAPRGRCKARIGTPLEWVWSERAAG